MSRLSRLLGAGLCLACAATPLLHGATIATFTGADSGEGLDFQGRFVYAVNVGTTGAAGRVGDAVFTSDASVPGATLTAPNEVTAWLAANYGDSEADNNLEKVMGDIRWNAAPGTVVLRLTVEAGARYKLQLLFAESCCRNRAFDVKLEGQLVADEFNPSVVQGDDLTTVGAAIIEEFTAADDTYEIELDGNGVETPEYTDHNAILNGFTLERLSAVGDTDNDGLPDDWERRFFGGLDQKPTDDPDADGLNNGAENERGTNPTQADTDGDGLADGAEVNQHKSDPTKTDTDGDTLADGREVNELKTDPTKADSDGDGSGDYVETLLGTNPADPNSISRRVVVQAFTGGDAGEGLDFQGNFIHALNVGGTDTATIGDVNFAPFSDADSAAGVTFEARNQIPSWVNPAFGDTANDDALELILTSMRWTPANDAEFPALNVIFDSLERGAEYKVQFLIAEGGGGGRAWDVYHDGALVVNEFNAWAIHRGSAGPKQGAVVAISFIARSTSAKFSFDGRTITTAAYGDHNPILNALTLEKLANAADTDSDTLPDAWENEFFGNLAQNANGDTDSDGVTNADEFSGGTNPARADTDGDGLSDSEERTAGTGAVNADTDGDGLLDGAEVKTHRSNPLAQDTDGDRLSDGEEVTRRGTDPTKKDTDNDGFDDLVESFSGTDPKSAASKPTLRMVTPFRGADPGEGLDFDGTFRYALNIGGPDGGTIRGANFVPATAIDVVEGVETEVVNEIQAWHAPNYGDSAEDDTLEMVMQSIRWSAAPAKPRFTLSGLTAGRAYKLQLLFAESCCSRGFDVVVNGTTVVDDFAPYIVQGGINNQAFGAAVAYSFKAASDKVEILLDGTAAPYGDKNPILNALTLEDLGVPGPEFNDPVSIARPTVANGSVTLTWSGGTGPFTVERKAQLSDAAWSPVGKVTERTLTLPAEGASGFFRVVE